MNREDQNIDKIEIEEGLELCLLNDQTLLKPELHEEEQEQFFYLTKDKLTRRYLSGISCRNKEQSKEKFQHLVYQCTYEGFLFFSIKKLSKTIGFILVAPPGSSSIENGNNIGRNSWELFFFLGKDWRKKGIMKDAIMGLIVALYNKRLIKDFIAVVDDFNKPSVRLMESIKFKKILTDTKQRKLILKSQFN